MTMLERAIAAAANAVGADPQDLRGVAKGARLREWRPGTGCFTNRRRMSGRASLGR
jgi:hypothetical protein